MLSSALVAPISTLSPEITVSIGTRYWERMCIYSISLDDFTILSSACFIDNVDKARNKPWVLMASRLSLGAAFGTTLPVDVNEET